MIGISTSGVLPNVARSARNVTFSIGTTKGHHTLVRIHDPFRRCRSEGNVLVWSYYVKATQFINRREIATFSIESFSLAFSGRGEGIPNWSPTEGEEISRCENFQRPQLLPEGLRR